MEANVRFEHVSKEYNLGRTRTSVPLLISNWLRRSAKIAPPSSAERSFWALNDISFELGKGDAMGLIGANGAGKTTMLKLLAKITKPTSGSIMVNGTLSALIELGAGFHGDLTGRENVYLNAAILGLKRQEIRRRFDQIVAFSEIERFIDTPVKRYSSGMLVRLGFSVASCIEPEILLVDEVLAVGDAAFRQKCLKRIQSLLESGTTIIFVSHDLNMVQGVCSSAIYLKHGQIMYHGATSDAIAKYERDLHEERARQLAENPQLEPDSGTTDVEITQLEVLNPCVSSEGEFYSEQPLEIRIHYRAFRSIEGANAVVRILRSDGLTCCRLRTSIDDAQLTLSKGEGVFSVVLEPLQLTGGMYFAIASIRTEMDLVRLATGQSNWFYVGGAPLNHTKDNGVFEPRRTWKCDSRPVVEGDAWMVSPTPSSNGVCDRTEDRQQYN